ncbi:TetR/AcrR family transcriptional regulator [Alicyclobacillus tolerans]|uniref:Transcriptional regulator, TetR family n=1 Tax=Alicyclobacillus tolerans TaxID=90970 RepID=A0A1M6KY77_9BACL|nr:TetR/AcrR family transcriptional regulator [Alicyclobacillus montanus]SHJ63792.1 transcriptional regulator, TetR family [Alicyclobacillus montanus]
MRQSMTKEQRHQHILNTAKWLFQEYGYDDITIADVIKESNIARGTFYLHFNSLEDLLTALFDEMVEQTWSRISPILDNLENSFEEATEATVRTVLRMFDHDKAMASVYYSGGGRAFMERKQEAMYGSLGDKLLEALNRRHEGRFQSKEDRWTILMLISLVGDMAYYAAMHIEESDKTTFENRIIRFVMAGLQAHLQSSETLS